VVNKTQRWFLQHRRFTLLLKLMVDGSTKSLTSTRNAFSIIKKWNKLKRNETNEKQNKTKQNKMQ